MGKAIGRMLVSAVLLLGAAAVGGYYLIEPAARVLVALGGRYLLGVNVRAGAVQFDGASWLLPESPFAVLTITDLRIGNPLGFESAQFMSVRRATLQFDRHSLGAPVVTVRRIILDGTHLNLERDGLTSNAGIIMNQLARVAASPRRVWEPDVLVRVGGTDFNNLSARVAYAPSLGDRGQASVHFDALQYGRTGGSGARPATVISELINRPVAMALKSARQPE